jgi:N12 class adenine-specific DNA methylase
VAVAGLGGPGRRVAPFRPSADEDRLPPSGAQGRARANLAVIRLIDELRAQERDATAAERDGVLARWSGWGACPELFDEQRAEWAEERAELASLVGEDGYAEARRTTLNAHYTHPEIAAAMWDLARGLGVARGRALEPGCGAGVFIGLAPKGMEMVGVELDGTTATIAQELYPDAKIINRSFAENSRRLTAGSFDLTIGNVPFGKVSLYDPQYNRAGHSIHNHFIVKSLALTRPGGLAVLLSSRYMLDAANPAARREVSCLADLIGAVRLPSGAHRRVAGTHAVTDLLVLRRRPESAQPADDSWVRTELVDVDGHDLRLNSYLAQHPEQVLGELKLARGLYENHELVVDGDPSAAAVAARIRAWGAHLADTVAGTRPVGPRAEDLRQRDTPGVDGGVLFAEPEPELVQAPEGLWDGHLVPLPSGEFAVVQDGLQVPFATARTIRAELRALCGLRDRARRLLRAEAESFTDTPAIDTERTLLRADYHEYVRGWGPINRFTERRTGRTDPETGEERTARIMPAAVRALRGDPFAPLVIGLEVFDEETGQAQPAALLRERVVAPRAPVLGADTPQDALAICLDSRGRVELENIAQLIGDTPEGARAQLGELVYDTPDGQLLPAAEYLSGNVREKLDAARLAAVARPELAVNVTALQRVLPPDLGADEVRPQLGAAWISGDEHREFLVEILRDPTLEVERAGGGVWGVQGNNASIAARSEWGTSRMAAPAIAKALLEQRGVQVTDEVDDGRRVVNPVETAAAQEKADAIKERFAEWCWEDPERAERLLAEYNRRFNSIVLRDYSADGERLSLPGLVRTFTPMPHQRAAVARILSEPAVGLFHQVGAGKTAEMIIGAGELRRLGMVRKPVIVVPNHMLEQFTREWLQLYPQARILAASSDDLAGDKRRQFVARAAANDWDGVLMTRSAFERIPLSPDTQAWYLRREVEQLRAALTAARGREGRSLTVKRLEKMLLAREERLKKQTDAIKDVGISFEETGIDYVFVDEAHGYKNLETVSNIRDAQIGGSKRATDLHMKLEWLRARHGHRVATLATATPIANSITEAHVMQRYLRPDLMAAAGVEHFDDWAATFGQTVTEIEMAPTGGGNYRMNTRFARFQNVPEMLRMWHVFADVKTAEDLKLPTPELKAHRAEDGAERRAPKTVVIPAGPEITAYLRELADRAEKVRARSVDPSEDNMLKISGDGRRAALDMRLVSGKRTAGECKLERATTVIARLWRENRANTYLDPDSGEPSPTPGGLQIVFCDVSTPGERWNAYAELRALLAAEGVPEQQIRFVHEARNDAEKGRLFAACRAGHVAVLIGSTEKMGVGTNIQPRAVALHHLDCPWRPADIEQREGRILRQGNQNVSVEIYRYVVERSFDAYSWQTVERKAKFIAQVTRGRLDVRSIEDIADQALSYTEVKALASGDPLILEHARVSNEVTRLERLERAWVKNREQLRYTLASAVEREKARGQDVEAIEQAIARRVDTRGERFAMTIGAVRYTERTAAAAALVRWGQTAPLGRATPIGQLGGFQVNGVVKVDYVNGGREAHLALEGVPAEAPHATMKHLAESPLTLLRQLEHRIGDLEQRQARTIVSRQEAAQDIARAREGLDRPFKSAAELQAHRAELATITEQMRAAAQSLPASADASAPAERGPGGTSAVDDVGERDDTSRLEPHPPHDKSRRPGRDAARYRARPRPPVTTPPEIHSHTPPSGLEL